jgi:acyl-CoA synthetase (AMP-forming)/AMP-acid ligase II
MIYLLAEPGRVRRLAGPEFDASDKGVGGIKAGQDKVRPRYSHGNPLMIEAYNLGALFDPELGADRVALIDCRDWKRPREYTHRQIDKLANACARGLLARSLERGDSVAVLSANRAEYLIAYFGILRAGLVAVLINHKLPAETIAFILKDAGVGYVLCDAARRGDLPSDVAILDFDAADGDGFEALLDPGSFEAVRPTDDEVAMVLYTSGSTGRPKGVPLAHAGHLWVLRARTRRGWPFTHHRLLVAAPLYHMNALCTSLFALGTSACEILLPEFDARRWLQSIERFGCTWVTSVPAMLAMALREVDVLSRLDVSTVEKVRMGSAPVSRKLLDEVKETFPGADVVNVYGTTEAGPMVFGSRPGKVVPDLSVGWPIPEVEVKLVGADGTEGDEGVLWQRMPATMSEYLNLPERTQEVLTEDGWYISGDIFRLDADGAYYFVGRADDMFVCGGENIYPSEVETILESHPEIAQACVVPVPDDIKGEKPVAYVVRSKGAAIGEDEVKRFALAKAPAYQHPRMVLFANALPLAGPGKIDRKTLVAEARRLWAAQAQAGAVEG